MKTFSFLRRTLLMRMFPFLHFLFRSGWASRSYWFVSSVRLGRTFTPSHVRHDKTFIAPVPSPSPWLKACSEYNSVPKWIALHIDDSFSPLFLAFIIILLFFHLRHLFRFSSRLQSRGRTKTKKSWLWKTLRQICRSRGAATCRIMSRLMMHVFNQMSCWLLTDKDSRNRLHDCHCVSTGGSCRPATRQNDLHMHGCRTGRPAAMHRLSTNAFELDAGVCDARTVAQSETEIAYLEN